MDLFTGSTMDVEVFDGAALLTTPTGIYVARTTVTERSVTFTIEAGPYDDNAAAWLAMVALGAQTEGTTP